MSFASDPIILKAFLNESSESIASLERDLEALETDLANADLVNSVFRALHTIKGNSSFLDLKPLTEMVHEAESILERIRHNDDQMSQETIDVLFQVVELLRLMLANPEENHDTRSVMQQLLSYSKSNRPLVAPAAAPEPESSGFTKVFGAPAKPAEELRVVPTIRVEEAKIERMVDLVNELKMVRFGLEALPERLAALGDQARELSFLLETAVSKMARVTGDLGALAYSARLVPVNNIFRKFPRVVRDLSQRLGKQVELHIENGNAELDKAIVDAIAEPLTHLIRNSCDHGIESPSERRSRGKPLVGSIVLNSFVDVNSVVIEIRDDGRGIDTELVARKAVEKGLISQAKVSAMSVQEKLGLIFAPGFSTAEKITEVSGRGVGMDAVKSNINRLKGKVAIQSQVGLGTQIQLRFPLSVVVVSCLYIYLDDWCYAVPLQQVKQSRMLGRGQLLARKPLVSTPDAEVLPLYSLKDLLWERFSIAPNADQLPTLHICGEDGQDFALLVDRFSGMEDAVVQAVDSYISSIAGIQGGVIRKDGSVTVALNLEGLRSMLRDRPPLGYALFQKERPTEWDLTTNVPNSLGDLIAQLESTHVKARRSV